MNLRKNWLFWVFIYTANLLGKGPTIVSFSPQGVVKPIRQVVAKFSHPMIPFGDLRGAEGVFQFDCAIKGKPRWADTDTWVFDLDADLRSGTLCRFELNPNQRDLKGDLLEGKKVFEFSSGGPALKGVRPWEGMTITEDQTFILLADGKVSRESLAKHLYFAVEGIENKIESVLIEGKTREKILAKAYPYQYEDWRRNQLEIFVVKSKQRFPEGAKMSLIWEKGIASPSGVMTQFDQKYPFRVRGPFIARVNCERVNARSHCVPLTKISVNFSADVAESLLKQIRLKNAKGESKAPTESGNFYVSFEGPFEAQSELEISLPTNLVDSAGRRLVNSDRFPLKVRTDDYPPLIKFPADFGVIEANQPQFLPVTVRNVEQQLDVQLASLFKLNRPRPTVLLNWLEKTRKHPVTESLFSDRTGGLEQMAVPRTQGPEALEVVGIPLKGPGLYIAEVKSPKFGNRLREDRKPVYYRASVLVTNLSVHLKWGEEQSLIWVTQLDSGKPVSGAEVHLVDCKGGLLWRGITDKKGVVRTGKTKNKKQLPLCQSSFTGYKSSFVVATAARGKDFAFVHSDWQKGIEPWRYGIWTESTQNKIKAHTLLDRSLLRAGETLSMKHLMRKAVLKGFDYLSPSELPKNVMIKHEGSEKKFIYPLNWDKKGVAETQWKIPKLAPLGYYSIVLLKGDQENYYNSFYSGQFRVEAFRVPLLKGIISGPKERLTAPQSIGYHFSVSYLSGGGAGLLPITWRRQWRRAPSPYFESFSEFVFGNGGVSHTTGKSESISFPALDVLTFELDKFGAHRTTVKAIQSYSAPVQLFSEIEFRDPNGESQTVAHTQTLWPSNRLVGISTPTWVSEGSEMEVKMIVTDLDGAPIPGAKVTLEGLNRMTHSHRKRLTGGTYGYEHTEEVKSRGQLCKGETPEQGPFVCRVRAELASMLVLVASTEDDQGRLSKSHTSISVWGKGAWMPSENHSRIDVIAEKKRYSPGELAKFQVKMPFKEATALVTVEREAIDSYFVVSLSSKNPVIEIPIQGHYAPNIYVSVLLVRGRLGDSKPTAVVDLGKPNFKWGLTSVKVGWSAHELDVAVSTNEKIYQVRQEVVASIKVRSKDGSLPPEGTELAIAVVDEGLLQLQPNKSWDLLSAMMGHRGYSFINATAQMQVVGRRHFGLKAVDAGGGGGSSPTRELFDTLVYWKARVALNNQGEAKVRFKLNDSLSRFRLVAIANAREKFGKGSQSFRTTQDLLMFSGVPSSVRQGDQYEAQFTLRNNTEKFVNLSVEGMIKGVKALGRQAFGLAAGASRVVSWRVEVPVGVKKLTYELVAKNESGQRDSIRVDQKVFEVIPIRTYQASLMSLDSLKKISVSKPKGAEKGRGGLRLMLRSSLVAGAGKQVAEHMENYPFPCFEQKLSKAIATESKTLWTEVQGELPNYLDSNGLVKYFATQEYGSEILTAYAISIVHEAGLKFEGEYEKEMLGGLRAFIEGKLPTSSSLRTADLSVRKLIALEALSRFDQKIDSLVESVVVRIPLLPTSSLIDWYLVLSRVKLVKERAKRLEEVETQLKARLNYQGTMLGFSSESQDSLWWMMVSADLNAVRLVLALMESKSWRAQMPKLMRGAIERQRRGHWDTTVANTWGVLALKKFQTEFEKERLTGVTAIILDQIKKSVSWSSTSTEADRNFGWPMGQKTLAMNHQGNGTPWVTLQSLAAMPLLAPIESGYRIEKSIEPIQTTEKDKWHKGDIFRVTLKITAQADRTWVVVEDPIPAGSKILGSGLGGDSQMMTQSESNSGLWPIYVERRELSYRVFYDWVPKGTWSVQYTVQLNHSGEFKMPPTHIEAMYSPEMFSDRPNANMVILE